MNRKWSTGGFAYGIPLNDLIGLPLWDLRYRPTNLLPFDSVTRNSSDVKLKTSPNKLKTESEITVARKNIFNGKIVGNVLSKCNSSDFMWYYKKITHSNTFYLVKFYQFGKKKKSNCFLSAMFYNSNIKIHYQARQTSFLKPFLLHNN